MLLQYWYTITITHRRDVGGVAAISRIAPLPLHVVNGQLGRLQGHALQEIQISNSSHFFSQIDFLIQKLSKLISRINLKRNFKSTLLQQILIKSTHSVTYTNTRPKLLCFRRRQRFQKETVVVSTNINNFFYITNLLTYRCLDESM